MPGQVRTSPHSPPPSKKNPVLAVRCNNYSTILFKGFIRKFYIHASDTIFTIAFQIQKKLFAVLASNEVNLSAS